MSSDPASWLVVERGWKVVAADGSEVGRVHEIVGDTGKDIFDGLTVSSGVLGRPRYVPAERVRSITEGRVELDLAPGEAERLPAYEEPAPSERIVPEESLWQRIRRVFRG
jgi:hypothetical protein